MRILFITNNLPPVVDGVGDYTYNLACEFAKHGHEVHVVCRDKGEIRDDYQNIHVAKIVKRWNRRAGKTISAYIQEHDIDMVSLQYVPHGFHPKGLPFGLVLALKDIKKSGVKVMTFFHEVSVEYDECDVKHRVLEILMKCISLKVLSLSDMVATSIECYRGMLRKLDGKKRVELIPIASNIPEVSIDEDELHDLRSRVAAENEKIIAFFGRRDYSRCISAIDRLRDAGYNVKGLLIGKTGVGMNLFPDLFYRTGELEDVKISRYLQLADVMILPEKMPYGCSFKSGALIAGMRAGLPVITTEGKLTDSRLHDGKNIIFADMSSAQRLEEVLAEVIALDPHVLRRVGQNAKEAVAAMTWNNMYNHYLHLLNG